jgi:death-on-curing protein
VAPTKAVTPRFLSTEQIVAIHDEVLRRSGGSAGGGPRGDTYEGVDAAVQAVKNSYYDTVQELAAALAVYIVQGHVFLDGNKRTGAAAMLTFLEANGVPVRVDPETIAEMMIQLQRRAEAGASVAELVRWMAETLVAQSSPRRRRRPPRMRAR